MSAHFLGGVIAIKDMLLIEHARDSRRLSAKDRIDYHDTIDIFEQEKQKRIRQMAYWEIVW